MASLDVRCMNIEAQCVVVKRVPYIDKYGLCTTKPLKLNAFNVIYNNNQYRILSEISLEYHKYTRMYKIEGICS